jgi:hypothetical protein
MGSLYLLVTPNIMIGAPNEDGKPRLYINDGKVIVGNRKNA